MSKIAVVYWSGTGNTEVMAEAVAGRLKQKSFEVDLLFANSFGEDDLEKYDGFAFGCPAMGSEVLEEDVFEPMFESVESSLGNKPVVIFGSYEWNEGEWMTDWQERCKDHEINLVADGLAVYGYPEDDDVEKCQDLAEALAASF